jgi:hypothetical protein
MTETSITIRFVRCSGSLLNRLVAKAISGGELGFVAIHVECKMPDGTLLGAHADGGIAARAYDYDAGQFDWEQYVDVPCSQAQADAFHAYLTSMIGKPYDMAAIEQMAEGVIYGGDWNDDPDSASGAICSALIVRGFIAAFRAMAPAGPRTTTPRDDFYFLAGWCAAMGKPIAQPVVKGA